LAAFAKPISNPKVNKKICGDASNNNYEICGAGIYGVVIPICHRVELLVLLKFKVIVTGAFFPGYVIGRTEGPMENSEII
jgi:hypothetical protein